VGDIAWIPLTYSVLLTSFASVASFVPNLAIFIPGARLFATSWFRNVHIFVDRTAVCHTKSPIVHTKGNKMIANDNRNGNTLCSVSCSGSAQHNDFLAAPQYFVILLFRPAPSMRIQSQSFKGGGGAWMRHEESDHLTTNGASRLLQETLSSRH